MPHNHTLYRTGLKRKVWLRARETTSMMEAATWVSKSGDKFKENPSMYITTRKHGYNDYTWRLCM